MHNLLICWKPYQVLANKVAYRQWCLSASLFVSRWQHKRTKQTLSPHVSAPLRCAPQSMWTSL